MTAATRDEDFVAKVERLCVLGADLGLDHLVIREPSTLTWLLEARVNVPQTLDAACLEVCLDVHDRTATVVTNAIEAPRLREVELAGLPVAWLVVPWWEARDVRVADVVRDRRVGSDRPVGLPGALTVASELAAVRRVLTLRQHSLLTTVSGDAAAAATAVGDHLTPSTTGYEAAGLLASALLERGLDPVVLMVAGDEQMADHRHPLPTADPVGRRAMLVCCARRSGVIASVTRIVAFGEPGDRSAYLDLLEVERVFLDATRPDRRLGDIVTAGVTAYGVFGFDPDEWHRHHQGGLTGHLPREFPASPQSDHQLVLGQAVAWNPSGRGWKVEDTCIVTADGPTPLVSDGVWPTIRVGGRERPDILVK